MKSWRGISVGEWIERFASNVILLLLFLFMCFLCLSSFLETTYITTANVAGEYAEIISDNVFLNIIASTLIISALLLFYQHCDGISIKRLELALMAWTLIFGVGFIISVKLAAPWYSDSYIVINAAQKAAVGDLSQFGNYFIRFPFQLGFVLYSELFFRIFNILLPNMPEGYYCLALQGLNLLWLMLSYHALLKILASCFHEERAVKLCALLMFFSLPPILSSTFLYGNIPALGCGTVSFWMLLAFLREGKLRYGFLCAVFMTLAVLLKLNMLIFFVAAVIIWLIRLIKGFSVKSLLCLILTVVFVLGFKNSPQRLYEQRTETNFGTGIPMLAWMAMGFSEGHAGPGWYREDNTVRVFENSNHDQDFTAGMARKALSERIHYFASNPLEGIRFFSFKLRSQWNEPSYESFWINQVQGSYGEKKGLYTLLCDKGKIYTAGIMNQYQQIIFLGLLVCVLSFIHKKDICSCLLPLTVLGGILYHLLFEAKSQYSLSYFILMIPLAAIGFVRFFDYIEAKLKVRGATQ